MHVVRNRTREEGLIDYGSEGSLPVDHDWLLARPTPLHCLRVFTIITDRVSVSERTR